MARTPGFSSALHHQVYLIVGQLSSFKGLDLFRGRQLNRLINFLLYLPELLSLTLLTQILTLSVVCLQFISLCRYQLLTLLCY